MNAFYDGIAELCTTHEEVSAAERVMSLLVAGMAIMDGQSMARRGGKISEEEWRQMCEIAFRRVRGLYQEDYDS